MASRFTSHQIPCVSFFLFPPCMCPGWCEISDGMKYDCECVRIFRYFNISNLSNEIIFDRVEIFRKEIFLFFKYCYLSKYKYKEKDIIFESYAFFEDIFLQNFIFDRFKETSTRDDPWSESLSRTRSRGISEKDARQNISKEIIAAWCLFDKWKQV